MKSHLPRNTPWYNETDDDIWYYFAAQLPRECFILRV